MRHVFQTCFIAVPLFFCRVPASAEIKILAVTNAASFQPGLPDSGGLATIFCTGLTGIHGIVLPDQITLPVELAGVTVKIRGVPAPLLAVAAADSYQQINLQVPWERPAGTLPSVEVSQNGQTTGLAEVDGNWPAFFSDFRGNAIVQHADDYSLVTVDRPARPGEILVGYATGLGDVTPTVSTGAPAPLAPLSWVTVIDSVSVGGRETRVFFEGLAPGFVGVYQINFHVPDSAPSGELPLAFSVTSCPPFGVCGSPDFAPSVTAYGPSVKVAVR